MLHFLRATLVRFEFLFNLGDLIYGLSWDLYIAVVEQILAWNKSLFTSLAVVRC